MWRLLPTIRGRRTRVATGLALAVAGLAPAAAEAGVWTLSPLPAPPQDCALTSVGRVPGHATVWVVATCAGPQLVSYRRRANHPWEEILVPTSDDSSLHDVAAVNGRDVWAVGVAAGGFPGTRGLIEHWNGTAWAQVPSPDPGLGGAHETDLFGVALASPTSVWAVGYHTGRRSRLRTLVEHWNGSTWTVVPTPNTNALDNELNAVVTVPGTGSVWAFGAHATPTGGSRQRVGRFNELASVAAIPGTSGLWAVGNLSTERVVIMRWTGDSWRKTPSPFLGGCPELDGVVAISRVNAWAVGSGSGCGSSVGPLAEQYH